MAAVTYQPELKLKFGRPSVAALGLAGQTPTLRLLDKTTAGKYLAGHALAASELVPRNQNTPRARRHPRGVPEPSRDTIRKAARAGHRPRAAPSRFQQKTTGWARVENSSQHLPAYLDEFAFRFNNCESPYLFRDTLLRLIERSGALDEARLLVDSSMAPAKKGARRRGQARWIAAVPRASGT